MALQKFKKFSKSILLNYFPWTLDIYNRSFSESERMMSRDELFKNKFGSQKINKKNKNFKFNLDQITPETSTKIEKSIPSLFGWLPYVNKKTGLFIYHFFSQNYGLKKNFLLRLSLIKNINVIKQNCFWIPPNTIHEFNLEEIWKNNDGATFFVEVFHPQIPKNHGGSDGHFRCWGNYYDDDSNLRCTTHSMNLRKKVKYTKKALWPRSMISANKHEATKHFARDHVIIKNNDEQLTHLGFSMIVDRKENPIAVWHNGGVENKKYSPKNSKSIKTSQSFWCPPSDNLDPLIFIDSFETQLTNNESNFYLVENNKIIESKKINFEKSFKMSVSQIFEKKIKGPYTLMVEFYYNNFAYCNINYNNNKSSGDNVHAHESFWREEEGKFLPLLLKDKKTAKKFFYFKKLEPNVTNYILLNINKKEQYLSKQIKFRILLDNNKEYLKSIEVNFDKIILDINLNELFDFSSFGKFNYGIIQLESLYDNMQASFISHNKFNDIVCTDHFTGG